MFKQKYKNFIYFQNGSIGDYLMTIFFLENIHLNNPSIKIIVALPKNALFLSKIANKYPYIEIASIGVKKYQNILGTIKMIKYVFSRNIVITPPTPGYIPLSLKIFAKFLTIFPGSLLIGFEDTKKISKYFFDVLFKYDTKVVYSDFLKSILLKLGYVIKREKPFLIYNSNDGVLNKLNLIKNKYVVLHPIASTIGRSLNSDEIEQIIKLVLKTDSELKIVITGTKSDMLKYQLIAFSDKDSVVFVTDSQIDELCNLINYSKLYIGVDTGTTHIASFIRKKSLIISKRGTPNWLPYYNDNATILYCVKDCNHDIYEGIEHLRNCIGSRALQGILSDISMDIISKKLFKILENE